MIDYGVGGTRVGDLDFPTGVTRKVLDSKHTFYTKDQILAVLNAVVKEQYVSETHDCDDFAQDAEFAAHSKLPGVPFGFATGKLANGNAHAVNVFVVKEMIPVNGVMQSGLKRYYYDATARQLLSSFDVDFIMI
jgi:hypothetical protein